MTTTEERRRLLAERRLRVLEAVLPKVDPSWTVQVPREAVAKVLAVAGPLLAWVESGEVRPR